MADFRLGEASRAVSIERCMRINDRLVLDPREEIKRRDLVDGHIVVVKLGGKQHLVFHVDTS